MSSTENIDNYEENELAAELIDSAFANIESDNNKSNTNEITDDNAIDNSTVNVDQALSYISAMTTSKKNKFVFSPDINKEQFQAAMEESVRFQELMMMYRCAIREIQTKLEVLNDEFKTRSKRNPIDSIRSRIKSPKSIFEKLQRKGFEISIPSIVNNLNDVAGIRVVCPFISDIYDVANMLISQDDIEVMEVKDYIKHPKSNGYRSLHYVLIIPIFMSSGKEYMKVEVQIRTIAMNFWASLEHQMHYKKFGPDDMPAIVDELTKCAETIYNTDVRMQEIRETIHNSKI